MSSLKYDRKSTFSAGPSALPVEVLEKARDELLNYRGAGISVMEMSHRSPEFDEIVNSGVANVRKLLNVPDNYKIISMQAGGTGQFAAVAMNLMRLKPGHKADYVVTGAWSEKAVKEAQKYGKANLVLPATKKYTEIPDQSQWTMDPEASYLYYCANETIHGVEFQDIPDHHPSVPLVCDMSSNMMSRPVDVSKFGLIYFGAQKNVGPAGVVMVIVREDLLGHAAPETPMVFDYTLMAKNNSLLHTPPCYSMYMCSLVFEWLLANGGVSAMEERSIKKSSTIYDIVDNSDNFYHCAVDRKCRSRMNVPFRVGGPQGDEALEKKFLAEAREQDMIQLKGHRSVGGIRVSLYNAITIEQTMKIADFMKEFRAKHSS